MNRSFSRNGSTTIESVLILYNDLSSIKGKYTIVIVSDACVHVIAGKL